MIVSVIEIEIAQLTLPKTATLSNVFLHFTFATNWSNYLEVTTVSGYHSVMYCEV
jgi:hypothetical protein